MDQRRQTGSDRGDRRRPTRVATLVLLALAASGCTTAARTSAGTGGAVPGWIMVRQGDCATAAATWTEGCLTLTADTRQTDPATVQVVGVCEPTPIRLDQPVTVGFELDWNGQANGCYLSAGLWLAPVAGAAFPETGPAWLKVEYLGVPPGQTGRCQVATARGGNLRLLHTEGWPQQRAGRPLARQHLELRFAGPRLTVVENGRELWSGVHGCEFTRAHAYLLLTSHSNYPARTVYFRGLRLAAAGPASP